MVEVAPIGPDHFAKACEWLSDDDINHWLTSEWRGREVNATTLGILLRNKRNRLLLVQYNGEPCGLVGFADIDEIDGVAMVWYLLGKSPEGGRGITTAAVSAALGLAFDEYGLSNVYAWIIEDNHPSRRVLEKNGFTELGRFRKATRSGDRQVDRVYFDITSDDFIQRSATPG